MRRLLSRVSRTQLGKRRTGTSYVAIERIARAVSALEVKALQQTGYNADGTPKTAELPRDHWLNILRENPSGMGDAALEYLTFEEVIKQIVRWRKSAGSAFVWTPDGTTDGTGKYPIKIFPLPPGRVEIVGDKNIIDHYVLHSATGQRKLSRREVCYLPVLSTFDDPHESLTRGYAPAEAVDDSIEAEEAMTQFIADFHREGMMPPVIFESSGPDAHEFDPSDTDSPNSWNAFVARWSERFSGRKKQHIGKIPHGWTAKVVDLITNLRGFSEITDKIGDRIIQAFGIPLSMLKGNAANYATARVDNYIFRIDEVEPEATTIYRVLTRHFRKYEPDVVIQHVPAIDEDPEQARDDETHLFVSGAITPNEIRERHGLKKVANPALDLFYVNNVALPDPKAPPPVVAPTGPPQLPASTPEGDKPMEEMPMGEKPVVEPATGNGGKGLRHLTGEDIMNYVKSL